MRGRVFETELMPLQDTGCLDGKPDRGEPIDPPCARTREYPEPFGCAEKSPRNSGPVTHGGNDPDLARAPGGALQCRDLGCTSIVSGA